MSTTSNSTPRNHRQSYNQTKLIKPQFWQCRLIWIWKSLSWWSISDSPTQTFGWWSEQMGIYRMYEIFITWIHRVSSPARQVERQTTLFSSFDKSEAGRLLSWTKYHTEAMAEKPPHQQHVQQGVPEEIRLSGELESPGQGSPPTGLFQRALLR